MRRETEAERVYILSLGSQQGNSHVHWHIAPLPAGVPFEEEQLAALSIEPGVLDLTEETMASLAEGIGRRIDSRGAYTPEQLSHTIIDMEDAPMAMQTVTIELPEEIISLLGTEESASDTAHDLVVLELLRQGKIGQGRAARLLGITRYELLDLMAERQIPAAPRTVEDAKAEIGRINKLSRH